MSIYNRIYSHIQCPRANAQMPKSKRPNAQAQMPQGDRRALFSAAPHIAGTGLLKRAALCGSSCAFPVAGIAVACDD